MRRGRGKIAQRNDEEGKRKDNGETLQLNLDQSMYRNIENIQLMRLSGPSLETYQLYVIHEVGLPSFKL